MFNRSNTALLPVTSMCNWPDAVLVYEGTNYEILPHKKQEMKNEKEIKLTPPEGWEIDEEKSSLKDCKIIYKEKKKEALDNILEKMAGTGSLTFTYIGKRLRDKIEALGKLAIVAEYVNNPELNKEWYICIFDGKIEAVSLFNKYQIGFTSIEAAKRAIDILGEDVIRTACQ